MAIVLITMKRIPTVRGDRMVHYVAPYFTRQTLYRVASDSVYKYQGRYYVQRNGKSAMVNGAPIWREGYASVYLSAKQAKRLGL